MLVIVLNIVGWTLLILGFASGEKDFFLAALPLFILGMLLSRR